MKTIRTHLRPHLDDICAFWLLKRYLPEAKDAAIDFVPAAERATCKDGDGVVHVGVGKGKYDEHKGDVDDCATTLVWKDILSQVQLPDDERLAVQKIVDWAFLEDTGMLGAEPHRLFAIPSLITGYYETHGKDSHAVTAFGFELLDALVHVARAEVKIDREWASHVAFDSVYGKAAAVTGSSKGLDSYVYARGFDVAVIADPNGKYHTVRAKGESNVDLTPLAEKLKAADPTAEWFFHHSKKMLICGGEHMPFSATSRLTLAEIVKLMIT